MTTAQQQFDPVAYKKTTREQWDNAAAAWDAWGPTLDEWLGEATAIMLDLARVAAGSRVLDIAAGAGGQSLAAARRAGPQGRVLATDISARILEFAERRIAEAGLANATTMVMDGEDLAVQAGHYDAAISRVGLSYFPDRQGALASARRAAARRPAVGHRVRGGRRQRVLLGAGLDHQARGRPRPATARPARPVQPGR